MTTLILGALNEELSELRRRLRERRDERWSGLAISTGRLDSSEVVVAQTGIGKTMAAATSQYLVDRFHPQRMILVGIAGALNPTLCIGDLLVGLDCVQHDLDARAAGFELGQIPFTEHRFLASDQGLVDAALSFAPAGYALHAGRILTGDRLLTQRSEGAALADELRGDAVEMEGASVALVALLNGLPFLVLRVISDRLGEATGGGIKRFLPVAAERCCAVVRHLLTAATDRAAVDTRPSER